ncbi:MAG: imidazolonepropionase, partial [Flavobacteriales bacterium]
MPSLLIRNIGELLLATDAHSAPLQLGKGMKSANIKNAWLRTDGDIISDYGRMADLGTDIPSGIDVIDATGALVLPAWCDSHTHLLFADSREEEFCWRLSGMDYEEIAKRGGGILNSAKKMAAADEGKLLEDSLCRMEEMALSGTGAVEIKSGYGLTSESELKMLRVIKKLKEQSPLTVKATFLGAHAIPESFRGDSVGYITHIIDEILPAIAEEGLADFIDIFCERGFFTSDDMSRLLEEGWKYGLPPKVHVNQFSSTGGVAVAVQNKALSVDHLEVVEDADLLALKGNGTIATLLPACSFFLNIPYAPATKLMQAGIPLALATDFNPGSAPSGNMPFVVSLACLKMGMQPLDAVSAATLNGAYAMGLEATHGSISRGKKANLIITNPMSSIAGIPYYFGSNPAAIVILNG